jgi:C-terminal processing protease CtpA/Prc
VVNGIDGGGPADKGGLKRFDILLALGEKPLKSTENLVERIQESGGKTLSVKVLRGGKPLTLELTPEPRKGNGTDESGDKTVVYAVRPSTRYSVVGRIPSSLPDRQVDDLMREVKELRRAVEELQKSLRANAGSPRGDRP